MWGRVEVGGWFRGVGGRKTVDGMHCLREESVFSSKGGEIPLR